MHVEFSQKGARMRERYGLYKKAIWKVSPYKAERNLNETQSVIRRQIRNLQIWQNLMRGIIFTLIIPFNPQLISIMGSFFYFIFILSIALLIPYIICFFLFTTLIYRPEITEELLEKIK